MNRRVLIIIGTEHTALCSVLHGIKESSGVIMLANGGQVTVKELKELSERLERQKSFDEIIQECEPLHFTSYDEYKYNDCDYKLELEEKPINFNRKQIINYPKPIIKPRFVRRGNRGK